MADKPIIFAMANPDPEITPEDALAVSPDAILATGRSGYPNQVNNVLGFPYIFRGALDCRASTINDEMKLCRRPRAGRARPRAGAGRGEQGLWREVELRAELHHPDAVRSASDRDRAAGRGQGRRRDRVAQKPIQNMDAYRLELRARLDSVRKPHSA
jgi:malate dehydrogenase (oxaloacetate-decarboxylating)(NADP+)